MAYNTPAQKGHRDRTSPERIARTTLEAEALRLRREGHAFDEIAEMLGISGKDPDAKARYLVETALERKGKPDANALRHDMDDKLDRLYNRAWRIAQKDGPDRIAAVNACVNVIARRSALVGADAPKQVDLKDERTHSLDATSRQKLVERLAAEAEQAESEGGG